jgi:hypothetical protein
LLLASACGGVDAGEEHFGGDEAIGTVQQGLAGVEVAVSPNGIDDTANIQEQLNLGNIVRLRAGERYLISQRLDVIANNSGILSRGAPATLLMTKTFNNTDPNTMFSAPCPTAPCPAVRSDSVGIRAENVTDLVLENFKVEKAYIDGTYVSGIWLRNVTRAKVEDVELWGFSLGPIVAIDSVSDTTIRGCTIRDSWAGVVSSDPNLRKFPQLTGIRVDDEKANGVGSTRVVIAHNTIKKLRFKQSLYQMPRNLFIGMATATGQVGYQTDGITVASDAHHLTINGNFIDTVAEGIDAMGEHIRIEENLITNTWDFAVKFVHGGSHNVASRNTLAAAGTANMYVAGSEMTNVGNTFDNRFTENTISRTGDRSKYCGASAEVAFRIDSCPTGAIASAGFVQLNVRKPELEHQIPYYNLFQGNTVTVSSSDTRMGHLFRVDEGTQSSLFYGNTCTGPCPASQISPNAPGTVVDPAADRLAVGDMDNNGLDDFFVSWSGTGKNLLYRVNTDRTVETFTDLIGRASINGSPDLVRTGDFDNDGHTDLFFFWKRAGTNRFFYGNSVGRFNEVDDPIAATAINSSADSVLTGDFDGDHHTDLLFFWKQPGTNRFFYGNGLGSFTYAGDPIAATAINSSPDSTLTGDFDGDRRTDLLFFWGPTGTNRFFFGTGRGTFEYPGGDLIPPGYVTNSPARVFSFDADLDQRDDVEFFWFGDGGQRLYLGQWNRRFVLD